MYEWTSKTFFSFNMSEKPFIPFSSYNPFKTISFGEGVNYSAGLPIIRTSPDHGTGFDIAGKSIADPSSFKHALKLALDIYEARNKIL